VPSRSPNWRHQVDKGLEIRQSKNRRLQMPLRLWSLRSWHSPRACQEFLMSQPRFKLKAYQRATVWNKVQILKILNRIWQNRLLQSRLQPLLMTTRRAGTQKKKLKVGTLMATKMTSESVTRDNIWAIVKLQEVLRTCKPRGKLERLTPIVSSPSAQQLLLRRSNLT